jgi:hypothetical protein
MPERIYLLRYTFQLKVPEAGHYTEGIKVEYIALKISLIQMSTVA